MVINSHRHGPLGLSYSQQMCQPKFSHQETAFPTLCLSHTSSLPRGIWAVNPSISTLVSSPAPTPRLEGEWTQTLTVLSTSSHPALTPALEGGFWQSRDVPGQHCPCDNNQSHLSGEEAAVRLQQ